ncbi:hypothetical protein DID75_04480 [Candidatus Marinamargulisbacteria bacterium SCGC AG-410-N11]|nr:hypothetical protein DID75_04480 [Candidatus Marinamargulisbacteria bacterium SCGC AG-410-N11]
MVNTVRTGLLFVVFIFMSACTQLNNSSDPFLINLVQDNTPPSPVQLESISTQIQKNSIAINWSNPTEKDLSAIKMVVRSPKIISSPPTPSQIIDFNINASQSTVTVNTDLLVHGNDYIFDFISVDNSGNQSKSTLFSYTYLETSVCSVINQYVKVCYPESFRLEQTDTTSKLYDFSGNLLLTTSPISFSNNSFYELSLFSNADFLDDKSNLFNLDYSYLVNDGLTPTVVINDGYDNQHFMLIPIDDNNGIRVDINDSSQFTLDFLETSVQHHKWDAITPTSNLTQHDFKFASSISTSLIEMAVDINNYSDINITNNLGYLGTYYGNNSVYLFDYLSEIYNKSNSLETMLSNIPNSEIVNLHLFCIKLEPKPFTLFGFRYHESEDFIYFYNNSMFIPYHPTLGPQYIEIIAKPHGQKGFTKRYSLDELLTDYGDKETQDTLAKMKPLLREGYYKQEAYDYIENLFNMGYAKPTENSFENSMSNINATTSSSDNNSTITANRVTQQVLVEKFTATWCGPCAYSANLFQSTYSKNPSLKESSILLRYGIWGDDYSDQLSSELRQYLSERETFYGDIYGIPTAFYNGTKGTAHISDPTTLSSSASAMISIDLSRNNSSIDIELNQNISIDSNSSIIALLVEKEHVSNVAASNGQTHFEGIVLDLLLNETLSFTNNKASFSVTVDTIPSFNDHTVDDPAVVVFVQNNATKEIYQSAAIDVSPIP